MSDSPFDLIVIGGGPGGYVSAIRASQLGLKVGCVDKNEVLGGTCLRVGCIPSKALLVASEHYHNAHTQLAKYGVKVERVELDLPTMMKHKSKTVTILTKGIEGLLKKNKITHFKGVGTIQSATEVVVTDAEGNATTVQTSKILIATGSKVAPLKGVELDGDKIGTSTEALSYPAVPDHLVVIGAGVIGLELGSVWKRLGAKVTVLEYLDRIFPGMDAALAKEAQKTFTKQGIEFKLGQRVTAARVEGEKCVVECDGSEPITCDRVLLAVGRLPNTDQLGLEKIGVQVDKRGCIDVDSHYETNVKGIFAIGDVIKGPMLAHKAEEEGVACVEHIVTGYGHINYDVIPGIVYTEPEVASVGKSEEDLKAADIPYKKGQFPFMANGRAKAMGTTEGWVKILAHAKTDRVLGVHIIGPRAGDLIAEAAVAMDYGASSEDIARSCHAHPTLAEVVKEAALNVDGRALHM